MPESALAIRNLHVYYGRAHALQGVDLTLDHGVLAVVGRNGMGKTTLCNAIMGLIPASAGRITAGNSDILGLSPHVIVACGIAYVPQGRRVWPSLTVHEHLSLSAGASKSNGRWTIPRVYDTFARLGERKRHGGGELSGGEQQMLAIGRALVANPRLLIMDEPTEGLAPVIVEEVSAILRQLVEEREISILLIEQNLGVAASVAERVAVMVNGRIPQEMAAATFAGDRGLQRRLLGIGTTRDETDRGNTVSTGA